MKINIVNTQATLSKSDWKSMSEELVSRKYCYSDIILYDSIMFRIYYKYYNYLAYSCKLFDWKSTEQGMTSLQDARLLRMAIIA
jgi:hypothetical protein